ncbi:MAG: Ig-like domain-containing protein [Bacteroides sp.]|nr:Ig-like domain-containing protein [Bacteroides sp.]
MKKQIIGKVLAALIILAAGSYFVNVQAQEVSIRFTNPDGGDYGNPDGIGGRISGEVDPKITLEFKVGVAGQIELNASTISTNEDNIRVVDSWDNTNVGTTALQSTWGKSFTFILSSNKRLQAGKDGDGIGCQGTNQRRIDQAGAEEVYFTLEGDVGIEFTSIGYRDINYMEGVANFRLMDYDSDEVWFMENVGADDGAFDVTGVYGMRYKSDRLTVTTSDTTGNNNPGGRLLSLAFNVVEAQPKPPAVLSTDPPRGDSLSQNIADDYEIQFDAAMDQAATSAAITITPAVPNRADAWSDGDEGDILTLSFDDLEYETWYEVVLGAGTTGENGLTIVAPDTLTFKTLPEPPSVVATFPENLAVEVPIDSPVSIEFSKSMIDTTVEQSISFNPELGGLSFVWNEDNSAVYISSMEMVPSNMYFVEVGTGATDVFGIQMTEPFLFAFTTSIATAIENSKADEVVIYPNPATDVLQVSGMDVASFKLYNMSGQVIKEVYDSAVINLDNIKTGIYVVTVSDRDNNKHRQTIVIE